MVGADFENHYFSLRVHSYRCFFTEKKFSAAFFLSFTITSAYELIIHTVAFSLVKRKSKLFKRRFTNQPHPDFSAPLCRTSEKADECACAIHRAIPTCNNNNTPNSHISPYFLSNNYGL